MQPTNNYAPLAERFSRDLFDLNRKAFDDALTENIIFSSWAELVNPPAPVVTHSMTIEGKEKVTAGFAQRIFDITSDVDLQKLSCTALPEDRVFVEFITDETKKEQSGPVRYHYDGHYILTFREVTESVAKVSKIQLWNRREVVQSL